MPDYYQIDPPPLPEPRKKDGHKGEFGHVLVIAGSRRMMGAAIICSVAATRSGAGLVTLACPEDIQPFLSPAWPPALTLPLKQTPDGAIALGAWPQIEEACQTASVIALGPGLGRNRSTEMLVHRIVERSPLPLVIDADGLNALATQMQLLESAQAPVILTPHPGEMSRLTGRPVAEIQSERRAAAHNLASKYKCTVVLKGAGTVVAGEGQVYANATGNPYMAGGGSGDVLTGVIAGLLAQKMSPFEAARTGVYWHGLAADRAPNSAGPGAVAPTDILDQLRLSGTDVDWYNEELRIEEEELFTPDTEGDEEPRDLSW